MWCVNPVYIQRYCREVEKEEEEELQRGKVKSVAAMVALRRESVAVARWMGSVHGWRAVEGEEGKEGEGSGYGAGIYRACVRAFSRCRC